MDKRSASDKFAFRWWSLQAAGGLMLGWGLLLLGAEAGVSEA
ncbi:MAG: hypothetical protein ACPGLY_19850 [Rubripirellula sp.]